MIIKCFRCNKEIDTPDASNADYIIAPDTLVMEPREILVALKHNDVTLTKEAQKLEVRIFAEGETTRLEPKYPGLKIADSEYDAVEIPNFKASKNIVGLVKVKSKVKDKNIQKTGIICPSCYRGTDTVIWGVHK